MRYTYYTTIFCVLTTCLLSCRVKDNVIIEEKKMIKQSDILEFEKLSIESAENLWFIKYRKINKHINWNFKKDSLVSLKYVDSWRPVQTDNYLFYAELDSSNENHFVVTLMYPKKDFGIIDLEMYLKEANRQLIVDSNEILTGANFYFTSRADERRVIFGEISTTIDTLNYKVMTCYVEDNNNIYDLSMKVPLRKFDEDYYHIFNEYIDNFKYMNQSMLSTTSIVNYVEKVRIN